MSTQIDLSINNFGSTHQPKILVNTVNENTAFHFLFTLESFKKVFRSIFQIQLSLKNPNVLVLLPELFSKLHHNQFQNIRESIYF